MVEAIQSARAESFRLAGLRRLFGSQEAVLLGVIVLLFLVVGGINPRFLAERNLESILLGNAYVAVAAIGMSMVIVSGNIDISVGRRLPRDWDFVPVPTAVIAIVPEYRDYYFVYVEDE